MIDASRTDDGFEVVVAADGALRVSAAELARHGVRPGARVRLVIVGEGRGTARPGDEQGGERPKRKSMRGALAHMVSPEEVDAFVEGLTEMKAGWASALRPHDGEIPPTPR